MKSIRALHVIVFSGASVFLSLLAIHSILRWLVLLGLLATIIASFHGLRSGRKYIGLDSFLLKISNFLVQVQFMLGLVLYAIFSPLTQHFLSHGLSAFDMIAFFAVYHALMMFAAVGLMSVGAARTRKASEATQKFRFAAVFPAISLLLILAAIPWFRPLLPTF